MSVILRCDCRWNFTWPGLKSPISDKFREFFFAKKIGQTASGEHVLVLEVATNAATATAGPKSAHMCTDKQPSKAMTR